VVAQIYWLVRQVRKLADKLMVLNDGEVKFEVRNKKIGKAICEDIDEKIKGERDVHAFERRDNGDIALRKELVINNQRISDNEYTRWCLRPSAV